MKMWNKIKEKEAVSILKTSYAKQMIKENQELLNHYHLKFPCNKELDFFIFEIIVFSLKNKETIENAFLKAYDAMHDYWSSLVYTEKNHLIQVELKPMYESLKALKQEDEMIYIPIFDQRLNHIYASQMNLFELKQYDRLRFDLSSISLNYQLSKSAIRFGFTSLKMIYELKEYYYAYCPLNHVVYKIQGENCLAIYGFERCSGDLAELMECMLLLEKENECALLQFLLDHHWLSEKHEKKVEKYILKLLK